MNRGFRGCQKSHIGGQWSKATSLYCVFFFLELLDIQPTSKRSYHNDGCSVFFIFCAIKHEIHVLSTFPFRFCQGHKFWKALIEVISPVFQQSNAGQPHTSVKIQPRSLHPFSSHRYPISWVTNFLMPPHILNEALRLKLRWHKGSAI